MEYLATYSTIALCVFIAFWALDKAFKTARYYPGQPREAKKIIVKVGGKSVLITTRGGEQC